MSAKDPRRAILLRVPPALRPALRQVRARQRRPSTANALRHLVILGLQAPVVARVLDQPAVGRLLRLQLDPRTRARVAALAAAHGLSSASVVLCLAAEAAATMPLDRSAPAPLPSAQRGGPGSQTAQPTDRI